MNLSLAHLATLRELARLGTMSEVARSLGYTSGAVSQQVAALERSTGAKLVARAGRRVELTDAGAVLARHAEGILAAQDAALDAVRAVHQHAAAPVLVGAFGSAAAALLPKVASLVAARHPRLVLRSREFDVDDAAAAVARGQADVAFGLDYPGAPMPRAADVEVLTLGSETFTAAVSSGAYGIRTECVVDLAQASGWQWVMAPESTQFGRAARAACRAAGFEPRVDHEIIDTAASLAMVAQGLGATFVTDLMARLGPPAPIIRVSLRQPFTRRIVLIRRNGSDARPPVRAVTDAIRAAVAAL